MYGRSNRDEAAWPSIDLVITNDDRDVVNAEAAKQNQRNTDSMEAKTHTT